MDKAVNTESKTFSNISKSECLIAYKEVVDNSDSKWRLGKKLAKDKEYGSAIFMAVVSVEELVKAIIILMDGRGFSLRRVPGMKTIFKNHQIRHVLAYAMFVINIFSEESINFLKKFRENPEAGIKFMNDIVNKDELLMAKMNGWALKKVEMILREFDWFAQVDLFRQNGMYCDYKDGLKNPIRITEENYQEAYLRLEKVRMVGQSLVETLVSTDDLYVNHYAKMRRTFARDKYYDLIGGALTRLRETKNDPFVGIKKYFSGSDT
jgi:AbiV family abortive infection protein